MSKKRKKGSNRKPKTLSAANLEKRLVDLFSKQLTVRLDAKGVIKKLKISNSKDSVQHSLEELVNKGRLEQTNRGKYKWNKTAPTTKRERRGDEALAIGRVDATRSGSAYIICDNEVLELDVFVPPHKLLGALNGDTVEVAWHQSRKDKLEGKVVRIVERKLDQFIGTLSLSDKFAFVIPDNLNMQTDIFVHRKNIPKEAENGAKVVVTITKWHTDHKTSPEGKITTYFGTEGSNDIEMQSILIQKGFNLAFPPDVLKENAEIDTEIAAEEIAKRRDMRAITTFTIDPATAKDFDDALSVELLENGNYEIGIHIADVSHYVRPDSALDKEAANRTTSVYLVDRVLPMLPEKLSNGVCSLRPEEEKLTFSAIFELDHRANIVNEWFGRTVIYSDRRFTYEEAQERLETGEGDYVDELQLLNKYAHLLRNQRFKKGAINFESPEVRFVLDAKGVPVDVYLKERKDSNMLVEDFMLLANKRVGALIHGLHEKLDFVWPMIYRIHDEPDMDRVQNFTDFAAQMGYPMKIDSPDQVKKAFGKMLKEVEGKTEADILQQLAIRTMAKAVYSIDNIGHYGLGFATYSHFTSPIRRYADVLAHRILHDYLSGNNKRMNPKKLEESCKHISRKERDAMEAERESIKYKQAEFLEAHLQEIFEGTISGIADHGVYVSLTANFCEGMIRYEKMFDDFEPTEHKFQIKSPSCNYKMGDKVWVRILGASKSRRQIDMELLDPEDPDNTPPVRKIPTTTPRIIIEPVEEKVVETVVPKEVLPKSETNTVEPKKVITARKSNKQKVEPEPQRGRKVIKSDYKADNRAYENLLPKIAKVYKKSSIYKIAKEKNTKWFYELSPAAPIPKSVLLLELNPTAALNKGYRAQKLLSSHPYKPAGNTKSFFKNYFPDKRLSIGYLSPFRSLDEKQLDEQDIALSLPTFEDYIQIMQPERIVAFSLILINTLRDLGLLSDMTEEEIDHNDRTIVVTSGFLTIKGVPFPIAFVPRPSSRLLKVLKTKAWDWAFQPATDKE
ncbi:MAG: ribonuclease R [Aureispira sp.]